VLGGRGADLATPAANLEDAGEITRA